MSASSIVRNARIVAGLNRKTFSARTGVAESSLSQIERGRRKPTVDTVEKLLRHTGRSLIAIPTLREDVATIAAQISDAEESGRHDIALRLFIQANDNLAAEHDCIRVALAIVEPAPIGVKHWDAALAGLVEYRLREERLPIPSWTKAAGRTLARSWTFNAGEYVVPVARADVPKPFLERRVLIDVASLASA
jgi:transcriptional regulator with XRE-family HTH domain